MATTEFSFRRAAQAALALPLAACATPITPPLAQAQQADALRALQASDLRVAAVAYRLALAGNAICPRKAALLGVSLHEPAQYAPELREAARTAFGLADRVTVLAVAPGSPADRAGLQAGDGLVTIGGQAVAATVPGRKGVFDGVAAAYRALVDTAASGPVSLQAERQGRVLPFTLTPVSGCVSQVQLVPAARIEAKADGTNLTITAGLLAYVVSDDELALVLAHEMAHNALGHRAQKEGQGIRRGLFGSYGANAAKVREAEREADYLAYFLMARAGYDPAAAAGFWRRLYDGPAGGHSKVTTHPDLQTRLEDARRAETIIESARLSGKLPTP